ncbi:MAG TPA: YciI family protein [Hyphomonadaceae bacterium]|nr:YciI family protein [Hyphomonadaceae bacterium]
MRFMMLMYPGPEAETETNPAEGKMDLLKAMMAFNQRMIDAGIMLAGDGLKPTSKGARVKFGRGTATVIDGPFTETKEILGGYWMINVGSLAEAVNWARQAPCPAGEMIEVRQVYEAEDFGPDVAERELDMIKQMSGGKKA